MKLGTCTLVHQLLGDVNPECKISHPQSLTSGENHPNTCLLKNATQDSSNKMKVT